MVVIIPRNWWRMQADAAGSRAAGRNGIRSAGPPFRSLRKAWWPQRRDERGDPRRPGNGPGGATNENVAEFLAPGYGGNGTLFFNGLGYQPEEMLVDAVDDIFVSDTDTVQLSTPPYSTMTPVPSRPDATIHTYQGYALSP